MRSHMCVGPQEKLLSRSLDSMTDVPGWLPWWNATGGWLGEYEARWVPSARRRSPLAKVLRFDGFEPWPDTLP
jgi:hypothetical protein